MGCAGKEGKGCTCIGFHPKDSSTSGDPKCKECRHRKSVHNRPENDTITSVLAAFDLGQLQNKTITNAEARRETNSGFRPKGASGASGSGKKSRLKRGSTEKGSETKMVKVGSIVVITAGVDKSGDIRDTKSPTGQAFEKLVRSGLAVEKGPNGEVLEFDPSWNPKCADRWLRDMLGSKPGVFQFLDARYGVPDPKSSEYSLHWVLLKKDRQKLYVKRQLASGEDLDDAKGTSSRNFKDYAVRIATQHKIPSALYKDGWSAAIESALAGNNLDSESDVPEKPSHKHKGRRSESKKRRTASPVSEGEAESSDKDQRVSSDLDLEAVDAKVPVKVEQQVEPRIPSRARRRSSRLSNATSVKIEEEDGLDVSSRWSSRRSSALLFVPGPPDDSDIEEISGFPVKFEWEVDGHLERGDSEVIPSKRAASPTSDISNSEKPERKRIRFSSRDSHQTGIDDTETSSYSPLLGPVNSSFQFDPATAGTATSSIMSGPSNSSAIPGSSTSVTSVSATTSSATSGGASTTRHTLCVTAIVRNYSYVPSAPHAGLKVPKPTTDPRA
ncbi:hypothetical protein B0H10DRAFT_1950740 [Mycena sp. CBHHK59/15]|nr:hypothetical protein B0H10DRAFT_1950740 [Mycena sp. CBHHK59/15]